MKVIAATIATVAALLVAVFVAAPHPAPAPAPVAAVQAQQPANPLGVRSYLAAVRAIGSGTTIAGRSDAELVASGQSLCTDLDNGATAATFARQVYEYGVDAGLFRSLLRVSVLTFCPQHVAAL